MVHQSLNGVADHLADSKREYWTLGEIADTYLVQLYRVQRLALSGRIPIAKRIGRLRVVRHADIPLVEQALQEAGYIVPVA